MTRKITAQKAAKPTDDGPVLLSKIDGNLIIIQAIARDFIERNPTREAEYEYLAEAGREVDGVLFAEKQGDFVVVIESRVVGRRRGLGTRMYALASKLSCLHFGKPLASDKARSAASEGFWVKQVKTGQAVCDEAMIETTVETTPFLDPEDRVEGRGGCVRYVAVCPPRKSGARLDREIAEVLAKKPVRKRAQRHKPKLY